MKKVLVTGCLGQIGSELITRLRQELGSENVIATDIRMPEVIEKNDIFEILDVMDYEKMRSIAEQYQVDTLIHLAALLSAVAEAKPQLAWNLNVTGLVNALEVAREFQLKFFTPSSIGAFGPNTPKDHTPQDTLQRPTTMYGVTKVAGELLCDYYYVKYRLRSLSYRLLARLHKKSIQGKYTSFIDQGTSMDMMYMPDAIDAIIKLMNADPDRLVHRNAFNISAMSFDPEEIKASIQKIIPDFEMDYDVDPVRQSIAESWPNSLDVSCAQEEWGFSPKYDLDVMTKDMLEKLKEKLVETV